MNSIIKRTGKKLILVVDRNRKVKYTINPDILPELPVVVAPKKTFQQIFSRLPVEIQSLIVSYWGTYSDEMYILKTSREAVKSYCRILSHPTKYFVEDYERVRNAFRVVAKIQQTPFSVILDNSGSKGVWDCIDGCDVYHPRLLNEYRNSIQNIYDVEKEVDKRIRSNAYMKATDCYNRGKRPSSLGNCSLEDYVRIVLAFKCRDISKGNRNPDIENLKEEARLESQKRRYFKDEKYVAKIDTTLNKFRASGTIDENTYVIMKTCAEFSDIAPADTRFELEWMKGRTATCLTSAVEGVRWLREYSAFNNTWKKIIEMAR